jgi:UDP-N-acetylglucosamine transferase subunit ALG13
MIFVTVGTGGIAFDRLIEAAADLDASREPLVVQHGASRLRPPAAVCHEFLPFDEMQTLMRLARVVIAHGGVGSVVLALLHGKRPIVVPRRKHFSEAVDDHQLGFARRLHRSGFVSLVEDPAELAAHPCLADGEGQRVTPIRRNVAVAAEIRRYLDARLGLTPVGTQAAPIVDWCARS